MVRASGCDQSTLGVCEADGLPWNAQQWCWGQRANKGEFSAHFIMTVFKQCKCGMR